MKNYARFIKFFPGFMKLLEAVMFGWLNLKQKFNHTYEN
jgi:hypothetical protein